MNKKSIFLLFASLSVLIFSCKKDKPDEQQGTESYMNLSAGSSRTYSFQQNNPPTTATSYTLTPAGRDTSISGKSFAIFNNSGGTLEYYNVTGNDYFSLITVPGGLSDQLFVNLYLKADQPVNASWIQNVSFDVPGIPFPISLILTNKIVEKNVTRTVGSIAYNNVIHVSTTVAGNVGPLPITGLNSDSNN